MKSKYFYPIYTSLQVKVVFVFVFYNGITVLLTKELFDHFFARSQTLGVMFSIHSSAAHLRSETFGKG